MGVHLPAPRPLRGPGWCVYFRDAPPYPGVYRVEHHPSGYVYVGSSARLESRRNDWMRNLSRISDPAYSDRPARFFNVSPSFHRIARDLPPDGWAFVLVEAFSVDTPLSRVHEAEMAEIARVQAASPGLCLNVYSNGGFPSYLVIQEFNARHRKACEAQGFRSAPPLDTQQAREAARRAWLLRQLRDPYVIARGSSDASVRARYRAMATSFFGVTPDGWAAFEREWSAHA